MAGESDVISLLTEDHRRVDRLFDAYEQSDDATEKRRLVQQMITELSIHAAVEEQFLYPVIRELPDGERLTEVALQEHQEVKQVLADLDNLGADDPELDRRVRELVADVRHHVEEEERDLFPALRETVGEERLLHMGQAVSLGKLLAPTHAHPEAPNTPPANFVVGPAAGIVDRFRDLLASGESPEQLQEQVLDLVSRSQDAIVKAVQAWTQAVNRLIPEMPGAANRPSGPADAIDQAFDFAERVLVDQRRFAQELLGRGRSEQAWEEVGGEEGAEADRSQRRPQRRASASRSRSGSDSQDYKQMTLADLRRLARDRDVPGRSGLSKSELVKALQKHDRQS
jgi:hemerythrin superfamily protein